MQHRNNNFQYTATVHVEMKYMKTLNYHEWCELSPCDDDPVTHALFVALFFFDECF